MYEKRKKFLKKLAEGKVLKGLEIGALDKPLVARDELKNGCKILYADYLSTKDLKTKYKMDSSVDQKKIVDIDLVSPTGDFADSLDENSLDYIVASHVVEHIPNPIRWFQMLFEILKPGGFIFLVVPDKRFTFDYQRPVTTFGTMLDSYLVSKTRPSAADVFDHYSSAVMVDGGKIWSGLLGSSDLIPLTTNERALKYAYEAHQDRKYHDVHVSIFTPLSFFSIVERLIQTKLFSPEIINFRDTDNNDIEFFVCLRKPDVDDKNLQQTCLKSIPCLQMETFLAPYMPQVKSLSESLQALTEAHTQLRNSYTESNLKTEKQRNQIRLLKDHLDLTQQVLNRKSIRLTLRIAHIFFTALTFFKKKKQ